MNVSANQKASYCQDVVVSLAAPFNASSWTKSALRCAALAATFFFCGSFLLEEEARAQTVEQETGLRFSAVAQKELNKQFKVFINPEMRTNGFNPDRYLLEVGVDYEPIKYLEITPAFRFELDEKKSGLTPEQRLRLDLTGKLPLGDFKPTFRLRYTASFSPEEEVGQRLRYQLGLDYDPTKRWSMGVAAELFQDLAPLSQLERMRYTAGVSYKFHRAKKMNIDQSVLFKYRFDYYLQEYLNAHIFELGYKFSF